MRACCELKIQGRQVVYRVRLLPGVFRSVLGETGETKLMTINGPEFSNEKHGSAGRCSRKVSKRLQMDFAS